MYQLRRAWLKNVDPKAARFEDAVLDLRVEGISESGIIIGNNASGKTILLKLILSILTPSIAPYNPGTALSHVALEWHDEETSEILLIGLVVHQAESVNSTVVRNWYTLYAPGGRGLQMPPFADQGKPDSFWRFRSRIEKQNEMEPTAHLAWIVSYSELEAHLLALRFDPSPYRQQFESLDSDREFESKIISCLGTEELAIELMNYLVTDKQKSKLSATLKAYFHSRQTGRRGNLDCEARSAVVDADPATALRALIVTLREVRDHYLASMDILAELLTVARKWISRVGGCAYQIELVHGPIQSDDVKIDHLFGLTSSEIGDFDGAAVGLLIINLLELVSSRIRVSLVRFSPNGIERISLRQVDLLSGNELALAVLSLHLAVRGCQTARFIGAKSDRAGTLFLDDLLGRINAPNSSAIYVKLAESMAVQLICASGTATSHQLAHFPTIAHIHQFKDNDSGKSLAHISSHPAALPTTHIEPGKVGWPVAWNPGLFPSSTLIDTFKILEPTYDDFAHERRGNIRAGILEEGCHTNGGISERIKARQVLATEADLLRVDDIIIPRISWVGHHSAVTVIQFDSPILVLGSSMIALRPLTPMRRGEIIFYLATSTAPLLPTILMNLMDSDGSPKMGSVA